MTYEQAYTEGFCKAAEVLGVDPMALAKTAQQIDAANALGAAGLLAGGAMGGSAVTGDDQSFLKRVGKLGTGLGLGYAGYKTMTDPRWQAGVHQGVAKAKELLGPVIAKIRGAAAKTASVKQAAPGGQTVQRILGALGRWKDAAKPALQKGWGRYKELMTGGNVDSGAATPWGDFKWRMGALAGRHGAENAKELWKSFGAGAATGGVLSGVGHGVLRLIRGGDQGQAQVQGD